MKSYLFIFSSPPYPGYTALESLELALAVSSFAQNVALLFTGEGVLQLLANQDLTSHGIKDFTKAYTGLHLFGIQDVYADQTSFETVAECNLLLHPRVLSLKQQQEIISQHDIVIGY